MFILVTEWYGPQVFVIKSVKKNTVLWTYVIKNCDGKEMVGTFNENELEKTNQKRT